MRINIIGPNRITVVGFWAETIYLFYCKTTRVMYRSFVYLVLYMHAVLSLLEIVVRKKIIILVCMCY